MWIFKLFQRSKAPLDYTPEELRDALQLELGDDYRTHLSEHSVVVERENTPIAFVDLVENGKKAVLFYEHTLRPYFAGDIALALEALLPTYLGDREYVVSKVETADGVH